MALVEEVVGCSRTVGHRGGSAWRRGTGAAAALFGSLVACGSGVEAPSGETGTMGTGTTLADPTSVTGSSDDDPTTAGSSPDVGGGLPEGCGDGIAQEGQYDCYVPFPMPDGGYSSTLGFDLDGDGREELITVHQGKTKVVWFHDDGTFTFGEPLEPEGAPSAESGRRDMRWDVDGDGRVDLVRTVQGAFEPPFGWYRNLGPEGLAPPEYQVVGPPGENGIGYPIAVDPGDGRLAFLVHTYTYHEMGWPVHDFRLRKQVDDTWVAVGPQLETPGCGAPEHAAYGDFDEDGFEDVLVYEGYPPCDPHPPDYDPTWDRFAVFLADPSEGLMQPAGTFPLGGRAQQGKWAYDVDRDGHLDLVVNAYDGLGPLVIRGLGDGTFAEPEKPAAIEEAFGSELLGSRGRYDGSGQLKFLMSTEHATAIISEDFSGSSLGIFLERRGVSGIVDVNGDGIHDYLFRDYETGDTGWTLMVSAP